MVTVAPGRGLQRSGVRAGFRLGQREGAGHLATGQQRQVAALLGRRAIGHQRLRADARVGAHAGPERHRALRQHHRRLHQFLGGHAGAAVFLWNRIAEHALRGHGVHDVAGHFVALRYLGLARHQAFTHEALQCVQEGIEDFRVSDHSVFRSSRHRQRQGIASSVRWVHRLHYQCFAILNIVYPYGRTRRQHHTKG
ncbi:hypothetical protein D3C85_1200590 [compost metagenome]